jgi:NAD(P)-dependent dehydrogenase (short-subunit alcohol dehydrogenase family)
MDLQLAKCVFFVTGGSRGIGKAICELLLKEGASVSTCSRNVEALSASRRPTAQRGRRFALALWLGGIFTFSRSVVGRKCNSVGSGAQHQDTAPAR